MVKINGENQDVAGKKLSEYLDMANYDVRRIVVERNGEIVPKATYDDVILENEDTIEIVSFVGGG